MPLVSLSATIALIVAVVALVGTIAQAVLPTLLGDRKLAQDRLEHYRGPLLTAAYELQARLHNILANQFVEDWIEDGKHAGMQDAAMETTLYVFAQFIAWREIIRRDLQYLRFHRSAETRQVHEMLQGITETLLDSKLGPQFMIWRVEQQGFGERMTEDRGGDLACIGYATFLERQESLGRWLVPLERDLRAIDEQGRARLVLLQRQLLALVHKLDVSGVWHSAGLGEV